MEPREIFGQLTATYGQPTPAALLQNNMPFQSMYSPQDAPEVLFRRIKDCQEVHILGEDPYMAQQLLNNAVCLLLQTGLYIRDFKDWDCKIAANKIWTNLKTFIQESYTHRLNATSITTGTHKDMYKMHTLHWQKTQNMVSSCVVQYSTLEYQKLCWVVSNLYLNHTYHVR